MTNSQIEALRALIHAGAADASQALSKWLHAPSVISVDALELLPLNQATEVLGAGDEPVCFCSMAMAGLLQGQLIFVFDDASGLALADLVLKRPATQERSWGEVETSAALETANIVGCAFLNSLQHQLSRQLPDVELLPAPPVFQREYVECLLQFALMSQVMRSDVVLLTEARFEVAGTNFDWTLLLIPDAQSIETLRSVLQG